MRHFYSRIRPAPSWQDPHPAKRLDAAIETLGKFHLVLDQFGCNGDITALEYAEDVLKTLRAMMSQQASLGPVDAATLFWQDVVLDRRETPAEHVQRIAARVMAQRAEIAEAASSHAMTEVRP